MAVLLLLSFLLIVYLGWKAGFSNSGESLFGNGHEDEPAGVEPHPARGPCIV
jgi:hypothetical protein